MRGQSTLRIVLMRRSKRWILLLLLCGQAAHAEFAGRTVGDVLSELRSQGLTFIYSTQLVPADQRVTAEPSATRGVELAREVLAQHQLGLRQVAPGVFVVVRAEAAPPPAPARRVPAAEDIDEVVVQTSRYSLSSQEVLAPTFITQEEVKNMPRLADETLRAVQRLPGVAGNGFSSLASVRGGAPNESSIILDGLRLYEPFHLKDFLSPVSLLDSRLIGELEFYSGGFPAQYGERMSGVIDAKSIRPAQPRYYELGLNVFHSSALAAGEFDSGRGQFVVSGRRSNIGDLSHFSENDFGEPNYYDAFLRADYKIDDATRESLHVLISQDSIHALKDAGVQKAKAEYQNFYVWNTLEHDWSDAFTTKAIASYTIVSNSRQGTVEDEFRNASVDDDRRFHIFGLRLDDQLHTDRVDYTFGAELRHLEGSYNYRSDVLIDADYPFPGDPARDVHRVIDPNPEGYETAAWFDARAQLSDRWTAEAGLRLDSQTYDHSGDAEQWSPRVSVMYQPNERTHVRATWGRYYQPQGINELQVEDGIDRFHAAQFADHWIFSVDHELDALDLRVEAYRKNYHHLAPHFENLLDPLVLLPETESDRVMIDANGAHVRGLEVMMRLKPHGPWSGWLNYTWSEAQDEIGGHEQARSWDQRHAINLGVAWTRGPWAFTLVDTYHSGWPTTQISLNPTPPPAVVIGTRNSKRLANYNSLDMRLTRTFALSHGALDAFLEVTNALSRNNPCCTTYTYTEDANGAASLDRETDNWLPLVPVVGVLWRY
ncbi:MAG TPA: TonB-dependent receptor [Steroidobacteraceae bacterium]|nr:TonB-dependent receptor [Steroidobacteraceae bacterium]